jgi:hypothetical protein
MSNDLFPENAIYIKWGRFQAGIVGRFAITASVIALALILGARFLGYWPF